MSDKPVSDEARHATKMAKKKAARAGTNGKSAGTEQASTPAEVGTDSDVGQVGSAD